MKDDSMTFFYVARTSIIILGPGPNRPRFLGLADIGETGKSFLGNNVI